MKLLNNLLILSLILQTILCTCPYGWEDVSSSKNEELCQTPSSYGRGAGYGWQVGDKLNLKAARRRCEKAHKDRGCEQWGLVIYPKCKEGYTNFACCICQPSCPSGYTSYTLNFQSQVPDYCGKKI